jgi:hypothetical protein
MIESVPDAGAPFSNNGMPVALKAGVSVQGLSASFADPDGRHAVLLLPVSFLATLWGVAGAWFGDGPLMLGLACVYAHG